MIGVIDYGAGNLHSVVKAFRFLGFSVRIIAAVNEFDGISRLVLPGVGHFESARKALSESGLDIPIDAWARSGRPLLGICLGMQLMFSGSEESADSFRGFEWLPGRVKALRGRKSLHIGWNDLEFNRDSPIFRGIDPRSRYYFVHRYYAEPENKRSVMARSDFNGFFAAVVQKESLTGVQFHPEKSAGPGLRLLKNWGDAC